MTSTIDLELPIRENLKRIWGRRKAWECPLPPAIQQCIPAQDQPSFIMALNAERLVLEGRQMLPEPDDCCGICLLSLQRQTEDISGKANRRKRYRLNRKMKQQDRSFLPQHSMEVLELNPYCSHVFHSPCLKMQRLSMAGMKCGMCRADITHTFRCDVLLQEEDRAIYFQLCVIKRALTPCHMLVVGQPCKNRDQCRFSHVIDGQLHLYGSNQVEEQWEEEESNEPITFQGNWDDLLLPSAPSPSQNQVFTRAGSVPRGPGSRGTGLIPVRVRATNQYIRLPENDVILDALSPNPLYDRNLPPRASRR